MDTPITRGEFEEYRRTAESEHERLQEEDKRQNHRLDAIEINLQQISNLVASVERLAANMENMAKEQKQQGERLETLEGRDGEMWRNVTGYVITAIIGILIGAIFVQFGIGG